MDWLVMPKKLKLTSLLALLFITLLTFTSLGQIGKALESNWDSQQVDWSNGPGSLVLDSKGNPHVSFEDNYYNVKYASLIGSKWIVQTIENSSGFVSLVLDSKDNPHICYSTFTTLQTSTPGITTSRADLQYVSWTGSNWDTQTVTQNGDGGYLVLDSKGNPHICYRDGNQQKLNYASWNGSRWDIQTVASCNGWGVLVLDSVENPHICYFSGGLNYASFDGSKWIIQNVAKPDRVGADIWCQCSLAFDSSGNPHICYSAGFGGGDLSYASWNGKAWDIQVILVGNYVSGSLVFDSKDYPHIVYESASQHTSSLYYSVWNGSAWNSDRIDSTDSSGALVLDSNENPHITYDYGYLTYATQLSSSENTNNPTTTAASTSSNDNKIIVTYAYTTVAALVAIIVVITFLVLLKKKQRIKI
jgi:hypothetical protein